MGEHLLAQALEALRDLRPGAFADRPHARLIIGAAENAREGLADLRDQGRNPVAETPPGTGRKANGAGPMGMPEVAEVEPVGGRRALRHRALQERQGRSHAAAAILADHENVEAGPSDREPEFKRLARPFVARQREGFADRGLADRETR